MIVLHRAERDNINQWGPTFCNSGQRIDMQGFIDAEKHKLIIEYSQVWSRMSIFNAGLALQHWTVI